MKCGYNPNILETALENLYFKQVNFSEYRDYISYIETTNAIGNVSPLQRLVLDTQN